MLETNFRFGTVRRLGDAITFETDKVKFEQIFQNKHGGVSLLAFKAGQRLDTHTAPADVMVYVLDGEIEFTMSEMRHNLRGGEFLLMGEGVPHSVEARLDTKVMLIKVKA